MSPARPTKGKARPEGRTVIAKNCEACPLFYRDDDDGWFDFDACGFPLEEAERPKGEYALEISNPKRRPVWCPLLKYGPLVIKA